MTHAYVCANLPVVPWENGVGTSGVGGGIVDRDRLGRRRAAGQERGLRPLHPLLPQTWLSRALRVAMSREDWERFDALVDAVQSKAQAPTQARAHGEVLSRLLDASASQRPAPGPLDWMDWERQKTLRLLRVRSAV